LIQEKELAIVNKQLSDIATTLATLGNEYKETERDIELIIKDSLSHFKTKEELTDFGFRSKKISAKSFADAAKLLDAMKKIKKNYKKPEQEVGKEVPKA
jgi:BMFP domain-containing protein YqiC